MQDITSAAFFELFSHNPIFYSLVKAGKKQSEISKILGVSSKLLKTFISNSLSHRFFPTFRFVKNMANAITDIPLSKSYQIFTYCNDHPEFKLNYEFLEYILFPDSLQFDQRALLNYFEDLPYLNKIKENYNKLLDLFSLNDSKIFNISDNNLDEETLQFRNTIRAITTLPNCIKSLNNHQRYFVNMALSLAYIGAKVQIDRGGHSSPHMKGQFIAQVRQNNTGILSTENNTVRDVSDEDFNRIKEWYYSNNHLYSQNPRDIDLDNFIVTQSSSTVICSISDRRVPQNTLANIILPEGLTAQRINIEHKYEVIVSKRSDPKQKIFMSLESALPLMFPVLFPYGTIPIIPGDTLRKKAQNLLLSCDSIRCTGVGCQLILFLFDNITRCEYNFSAYQRQRLRFPSDGNRAFVPVPRPEDPSFAFYWKQKEAEIRAMSFHYGYPDAMLTLTFNNKWDEVIEKSDSLGKSLFNRELHLDTCKVTHYVSRLEFQLRGAPHAHVLLWLESPLSIKQIDKIISAHIPDENLSPKLYRMVKGKMIHNCVPHRCYKNPNNPYCKYGFPKPPCEETNIDSNGKYSLKRSDEESRVVDYHPLLLLLWKGHVHLMFLKTAENPTKISTTGHYVLKYNMKPEPAYNVNLSIEDSVFAQIHARVVSVEECIARIFSLKFCIHDTTCIHLNGAPPNLRNASYNTRGNQIQLDQVQIYFNRPIELEKIGFVDFWSWYKVKVDTHGIRWVGNAPDFHRIRPPNTLNRNDPNFSYEDQFQLNEQITNPLPIYYDNNIHNAKHLIAIRRKKPAIVVINKYDLGSNRENYCFHILFISGCWRSDEEIKMNFDSYEEAARYHGIFSNINSSEIDQFFRSYIDYMIKSNRYEPHEIVRNISMIEQTTNTLDINQILNENSPNLDLRIRQIRQSYDDYKIIDLNQIQTESIEDNSNSINKMIGMHYSYFDRYAAQFLLDSEVQKLNPEQLLANNKITEAITRNNGNDSRFFIYGKAGTGKTFLINLITQFCIAKSYSYITTASTGIAASLINGRTFHSAFSIWMSPNGPVSTLNISNHHGLALSRVNVIIVDEITMLDRSVINAASNKLIDLSGSTGHQIQIPFAGKTVVFLGDPSQVPAVTHAHDDMSECAEQFMHFAGFDDFIPFNLKRLMRQNDPSQESFRSLLNEISKMNNGGLLSEEYQLMLRSRFHQEGISENESILLALNHSFPYIVSQIKGMIITYTNDRANFFNSFALNKIINQDNPMVSLISIISVSPDRSYIGNSNIVREQRLLNQQLIYETRPANEHDIHIYLNALRRKDTRCTVPYIFNSALNAKVILMRNIDIDRKLINGARGTIVGYVRREENGQIFAIKVKFDFQNYNEQPIEITRRIVNIYELTNGVSYTIYQFPLRLAWAVTAHKAQGQTLDKVSIDIGSQAFAHGAFYVALSRVRRLDDILFFGASNWPENGISFHVNDYIQQQTRAIMDEADHFFARNVVEQNENHVYNHNLLEEDNFLSDESDENDNNNDDFLFDDIFDEE